MSRLPYGDRPPVARAVARVFYIIGMVIFAVLVFAVCSGVAMILDGHL